MILLFVALSPCEAKEIDKISVTGKAEVTLQAHNATIYFKVRHLKKSMAESHSKLIATMSDLTKGLKAKGLKDDDIKKSLVLQGKEHTWKDDSYILSGYYSECYMESKINDISRIADVYNELAKYENVSITGTEFKRDDEFEIREAQFKAALLAAKKKAEHMARTLDAQLGKVHTIEEISAGGYWAPQGYSNAVSDSPVSESSAGYGSITISGKVRVEFELR